MMNKTKILIIDDEFSIRNALKLILEDGGYDVTTAATGRDGIKQFQLQHIDLTITDLCLPDVSGVDVFHRIRQLNNNSPFIFITCDAKPELSAEAKKCGANGFLLKPFKPVEIITLVGAATT